MTHTAGATRPMQRRVARRRSVPAKTRGVDPRPVDGQPLCTKRKTARVSGRRRCVGGGSEQKHPRARRRRVRRKIEAGSPGPHGSTRLARRDQRALKGTRTSREASGRSWSLRETTPLAARSRENRALDRTGGAESASQCPKGRSRAGASMRTPTPLDRRSSRPANTGRSGNRTPAGGLSQRGRTVLRQCRTDVGLTRGRDERPGR
jgi:hypothetical protein